MKFHLLRNTKGKKSLSKRNKNKKVDEISQQLVGCEISIRSPCFTTTSSSENYHDNDFNIKQEERDHSTCLSSVWNLMYRKNDKTATSMTDSKGDMTSSTASLSTSSQPKGGRQTSDGSCLISPNTISTTHTLKEDENLDSLMSPSDWKWQQCSMTSIQSPIQSSALVRPTPMRWKIIKRRKSSKVLKELSPKGPFSPTLVEEVLPTYLPVKQTQSQPHQPALSTIECTTLHSPKKSDRNAILLKRILWERRRVQMKKNVLNNGVEIYLNVYNGTTLGDGSAKSEGVHS